MNKKFQTKKRIKSGIIAKTISSKLGKPTIVNTTAFSDHFDVVVEGDFNEQEIKQVEIIIQEIESSEEISK